MLEPRARGIDRGMSGYDLSDPAQFQKWLERNGCPSEMRAKFARGEYRKAIATYEQRRAAQQPTVAPVTTRSTDPVPTHEQLVAELSRIDLQLRDEAEREDEYNRQRAEQLGREIRAAQDEEDDPESEPDDLFLCPACNADDQMALDWNESDRSLSRRCARCGYRDSLDRREMTEADVSSLRDKIEARARMRGARGY